MKTKPESDVRHDGRVGQSRLLIAVAIGLLGVGLPAQPTSVPVPRKVPVTSVVPPDAGADEPDEAEAEVSLKDGRQIVGALVERTPDHVVLKINGVATPFDMSTVVTIDEKPPVSQRYREMRAAIDDSDVEQRIRLAEWLRARRKYTLSLNEVTGILAREPDNPEARRLHTWLQEQLKLRQASAKAAQKPAEKSGGNAGEATGEAGRAGVYPLLTPSEINVMRVYEVDLGDPPKMMIAPETVTKFIETYAASPLIPPTRAGREALYRKRPAQLLELMFKLQARELYPSVQIQEDPRSIKLFRDRVHSTWLVNACATAQCHGGEDAGRLWLANRRPNADSTVYTNLLVLERFRLPGVPSAGAAPEGDAGTAKPVAKKEPNPGEKGLGGGVPLIDYDEPRKSPLLHLGLPRTKSLFPHPEVGGRTGQRSFSPIFQSPDDRRFEDAVSWIQSMYRPRPVYPIDFAPPVPAGAADQQRDDTNNEQAPKPTER